MTQKVILHSLLFPVLTLLWIDCLALSSDSQEAIVFIFPDPPLESTAHSKSQSSHAASGIVVPPSVITSSINRGESDRTVVTYCMRDFSVVKDCSVKITDVTVIENSGGHDHHSSNRPHGTVAPLILQSGSGGEMTFNYRAPESSGHVVISGTGASPDHPGVTFSGEVRIDVGVSGLVPLIAGDDYDLIGQTPTHRSNHYGRPEFIAALKSVAKQFNSVGNLKLQVNDISLPAGGVFDLNSNWAPSHFTHRFGNNADIRLVPVDKRRLLYDIFKQHGVTVFDEADHWHVSMD